jgi:DNA polymerase-3 subunit alpha
MFDLEDMAGIMRCILWPDAFVSQGELVQADSIRVLRGTVERRPGSEEANFIVSEIIPLEALAARYTRGIAVQLSEQSHGITKLEQLHEILRGYPGDCTVQLTLCLADGSRVACQCSDVQVAVHPEMRSRVEELLGPGHFHLLTAPRTTTAARGNGRGRR